MTQLSAQQLLALEKIKAWHEDARATGFARPFRLMGPAGTGKTTIAKEIPAALGLAPDTTLYEDAPEWGIKPAPPAVVYGTYTGKAAHVLRSKGAAPVSTIHSAIYYPTSSEEARRALAEARLELADLRSHMLDPAPSELDGTNARSELKTLSERIEELEAQIPELEANARRVAWEWNPDGPWASAALIVLDEVSMVDAKMAAHIEQYEVPILVIGDPAQLPPVEGGGYYTNATPDVLLTEVHRQALESPTLALATRIRESTGNTQYGSHPEIRLGLTPDDMVPASVREAMQHDQVICWSNNRRWSMIKGMRKLAGFPEGVPVPGDKVMCLTNNRDLAVFNGQMFEVLDSAPGTLGPTLTLRGDDGQTRQVPVYADGFLGRDMQDQAKKSGAGMRGQRMLATFGQAITCHKSQGSEWDSVYVVNELDRLVSMTARKEGIAAGLTYGRRWLYTAVSRAKNKVTITAPRPGR